MNLDHSHLDKYSRIAQWAYGVVAAVNVLMFFSPAGDLNNLAIALLLVVLIMAQKSIDGWRETAQAWRVAATGWQESAASWRALAERWRSEKWN
jgi:hypothetical protein